MAQRSRLWHTDGKDVVGKRPLNDDTDLSYLSAFYYTAATLLVLTGVFAALNHSWGMAGLCLILGMVLFGYRVRTAKSQK